MVIYPLTRCPQIFRGIEAAALVFQCVLLVFLSVKIRIRPLSALSRILTTAARQNLSLTLTALRVGFSFRTQFSPKLYH